MEALAEISEVRKPASGKQPGTPLDPTGHPKTEGTDMTISPSVTKATPAAEPATSEPAASAPEPARRHKRSLLLGLLPFVGVILFAVSAAQIVIGDRPADWQHQLALAAVVYLIGWAALGAGISHIFFGKAISRSIGFARSPYELEVGFANLGFGVAALMAGSFQKEYWLAIIVANSIFRVGCGAGHIKQIVMDRNYAINNTAILFLNFAVPAFLVFSYFAWA
jgi:hypothetical protein